jgi:uncharacterized protein (DUF302 family)
MLFVDSPKKRTSDDDPLGHKGDPLELIALLAREKGPAGCLRRKATEIDPCSIRSPVQQKERLMETFTVSEMTSYNVRRLNVPVSGVRPFQQGYEDAVPPLPLGVVTSLIEAGAPWHEMEQLINTRAPHGFLIYFKNDVHPVMRSAGDEADCVAYLMGNHVIAEKMFRHDPRAMLYAPLRTLIWEDPNHRAWFSVDQPSTQFGSLAISEVLKVGIELDRKLAQLLDALDLPVPNELTSS